MWSIRPASAEDALPLSELAERTFRETFAPLNTGEDMDRHCSRFYGLAIQAKEIASPKIATFVAAAEGSLIGYAQVHERASPSCIRTEPAVELRRLYVESSWHGKGVAQALMTAAIDEAKYRSAAALWLGVWEHNDRAIRFYRRQGFTEIGEQPFVLGRDVQRDIVMVILLRKAA